MTIIIHNMKRGAILPIDQDILTPQLATVPSAVMIVTGTMTITVVVAAGIAIIILHENIIAIHQVIIIVAMGNQETHPIVVLIDNEAGRLTVIPIMAQGLT